VGEEGPKKFMASLDNMMCKMKSQDLRDLGSGGTVETGLSKERTQELTTMFKEELNKSNSSEVLTVLGLRHVMMKLQRPYTSEELQQLMKDFGRDRTSLDLKGFLQMMHAIEIAKTHGKINPNKKKQSMKPMLNF